MTSAVRLAEDRDIAEAARTLSSAFEHYAWTRWSIPSDDYLARLERLQAAYLAHARANGLVLVSEDLRGVGAFLPPDCPPPSDQVQQEIGLLLGDRLPVLMGAELPPRPDGAWDLATLGVAPSHAGQGIGSVIIAEGLRRVSRSPWTRVALETSDSRNVALYERHGFATTDITLIPDGPVVYSMFLPGE